LAFVPGIYAAGAMDQDRLLPDTRQEARDWILEKVPAGATLVTDGPGISAGLPMDKEQIVALEKKTEAAGSPRARLYRAMADGHPGGGYRLYQITRTALELGTYRLHAELSQAETDMIDLRPGLDTARALRVDYVLTSSYGATAQRAPELAEFFRELESEAKLAAVFTPIPGRSTGPALRLYALKAL
jgi:hypothetical protein